MVVNSVGRVQVSVGRPDTTIQAWRNAERLAKRPGERFERSVIGIETDFGHRELCPRQLPGRSFQQQSSPHGNRRLLDHRPEQSIKLGAASISVAGEALAVLLLVERFQNHAAKPLRFIHKRKIPLQGPCSPDRKSQNDGFALLRPGNEATS